MHALWKGSINFGLVSIPINLYNGAESPGLPLKMLHKKEGSPIRYARICLAENKEIPYAEIVKGFELEKNQFVVLEDKDFLKASVNATHSIDIIEFVDQKQIDIRYFDKPYYLEPGKGGEKAYVLLREVLNSSKKAAIATFVLHNRQHIGLIKPVENILILNRIRYPREIRDIEFLKIPKRITLKPQEIQMAGMLVKQLTRKFLPKRLHDTYDENLEKIVKTKSKGKHINSRIAAVKPLKAKNLMTALRASLRRTSTKKK